MRPKEGILMLVGLAAGPIGIAVGRFHMIGPNIGTFTALGVLAAASTVGILHGVRNGPRYASSRATAPRESRQRWIGKAVFGSQRRF